MKKKHKHCWHARENKGYAKIRWCCFENTIHVESETTYKWFEEKHSKKFWESLFR